MLITIHLASTYSKPQKLKMSCSATDRFCERPSRSQTACPIQPIQVSKVTLKSLVKDTFPIEAVSCSTAEQFVKDVPELYVEGGVDDGVDSTVDVPQPGHHRDQRGPDVAGHTQHLGDMHHKEGCPAGQEHSYGKQWRGRHTETEPTAGVHTG